MRGQKCSQRAHRGGIHTLRASIDELMSIFEKVSRNVQELLNLIGHYGKRLIFGWKGTVVQVVTDVLWVSLKI